MARALAFTVAAVIAAVVACGGSNDKAPDPGVEAIEELFEEAAEDPAPEAPLLVAPPGCPEYLTQPSGEIREVTLSPADLTLAIPLGKVDQVQFQATLHYKDGHTFDPPAGEFALTEPGVGMILNTGLFTSIETTGGETWVTFTIAGVCGSAHLRVVQTLSDAGDTGLEDPAAIVEATLDASPNGQVELLYPPDGALSPADFPPVTVQFQAPSFPEYGLVRFEAAGARLDAMFKTAYVQQGEGYAYTIPKELWQGLFGINGVESFAVSVIGMSVASGKVDGKPVASGSRTLFVTRQTAGGAFYYWNTAGGAIRFLELGKEKPEGVKLPVGGCVGCHSISPDADVIAISPFVGSGFSSFNLVLANPVTGKEPGWIHENAKKQYSNGFTIAPAFCKVHWTETDKRIVVPSTTGGMMGKAGLYNIDLLTGVSATLVKSGDTGSPAFPAWSPSSSEVVYTSADGSGGPTSFAINGSSKLYKVPYNDGQGGTAEPLAGADEPGVLQYYPVYSPDGLWIAFNKAVEQLGPSCAVISGSGGSPNSGGTYDNCKAEVFIVPASGGKAIRLDRANGPDSPGVANSWPTFGVTAGAYYWIAFASRRDYGFLHQADPSGPATPQIWIAGVAPGKLMQGEDGSFAALWLPFQEMGSGNHIARWGVPPREL